MIDSTHGFPNLDTALNLVFTTLTVKVWKVPIFYFYLS